MSAVRLWQDEDRVSFRRRRTLAWWTLSIGGLHDWDLVPYPQGDIGANSTSVHGLQVSHKVWRDLEGFWDDDEKSGLHKIASWTHGQQMESDY